MTNNKAQSVPFDDNIQQSSDEILKNLILSIGETHRYMDIIQSYYSEMDKQNSSLVDAKYEKVLDSVSRLWLDSDKNPSLFRDTNDFEPILLKKG